MIVAADFPVRISEGYRDLVEHTVSGRHGSFQGRRYRRGKHRCRICGAPADSPDMEMPDVVERLFVLTKDNA